MSVAYFAGGHSFLGYLQSWYWRFHPYRGCWAYHISECKYYFSSTYLKQLITLKFHPSASRFPSTIFKASLCTRIVFLRFIVSSFISIQRFALFIVISWSSRWISTKCFTSAILKLFYQICTIILKLFRVFHWLLCQLV